MITLLRSYSLGSDVTSINQIAKACSSGFNTQDDVEDVSTNRQSK